MDGLGTVRAIGGAVRLRHMAAMEWPAIGAGFFSSWLLVPMFAVAAFSWAVFSLISAGLKCVRAEPA